MVLNQQHLPIYQKGLFFSVYCKINKNNAARALVRGGGPHRHRNDPGHHPGGRPLAVRFHEGGPANPVVLEVLVVIPLLMTIPDTLGRNER